MPPLPPLDPANTPRGYIQYTSGGITHHMSFRTDVGGTFIDITNMANDIVPTMLPLMDPGDSVLTLEASNAGSNIRFPLLAYGLPGTAVGGVNNELNRTAALSVTGKSTGGRIVSATLFTILAGAYVDTRLPIGVVASNVADWYAEVTDNSSYKLRAIDGNFVTWNGYINVSRNAYWQREQR